MDNSENTNQLEDKLQQIIKQKTDENEVLKNLLQRLEKVVSAVNKTEKNVRK